jgi:nucleoside-diphosphate kinase
MAIERTLSIIKPDATRRNLTGKITAMLEEAGLRVASMPFTASAPSTTTWWPS